MSLPPQGANQRTFRQATFTPSFSEAHALGYSHMTASLRTCPPVQNFNIDFKFEPFWKHNPSEWFYKLERRFETYRVTSDDDKYFNVVKNLTPDVLAKVDKFIEKEEDKINSFFK